MESKDLYQHLLGLSSPWTVERVELDMAKQHVDVHVGHIIAPGMGRIRLFERNGRLESVVELG